MIRVLGLSGSPRPDGNTARLLKRCLEGAACRGAAIKTVDLTGLDIAACRHCDGCFEDGRCIIEDDMQELYEEMKQADSIVLATPLQFMAVTAHVKLFMDRCQALWARKHILGLAPLGDENSRRGIFISTGGRKGARIFDGARLSVKALFASLDIQYFGELLYPGIDAEGDIDRHPTALTEAFDMGIRLLD
ncbi:MAG: flavodoxin family protein [Dehalococcoidaceae bacterium]|nr:flavodoxin family protein [Dehalococcoidaceae bacterium]